MRLINEAKQNFVLDIDGEKAGQFTGEQRGLRNLHVEFEGQAKIAIRRSDLRLVGGAPVLGISRVENHDGGDVVHAFPYTAGCAVLVGRILNARSQTGTSVRCKRTSVRCKQNPMTRSLLETLAVSAF